MSGCKNPVGLPFIIYLVEPYYYSVGHGVKVQTGYYNYRLFNRSLASAFAQPFWGLSLEIGKLKSL